MINSWALELIMVSPQLALVAELILEAGMPKSSKLIMVLSRSTETISVIN